MPVKQNSFTYLRVHLLGLTDRGAGLFWPSQTSDVDGLICPSLAGPLGRTLSLILQRLY
jgi:hypothetical protein